MSMISSVYLRYPAHFPDLTHINNKEDVVPILPGQILDHYSNRR